MLRWIVAGVVVGVILGLGLYIYFDLDPEKARLRQEGASLRKGAAQLQTENAQLREELAQAKRLASPPAEPTVQVMERRAAPSRDLVAVSREIFESFQRSGRAVTEAKTPEAEPYLKPFRIEELPADAQEAGETDGYTTFISLGTRRVYYVVKE